MELKHSCVIPLEEEDIFVTKIFLMNTSLFCVCETLSLRNNFFCFFVSKTEHFSSVLLFCLELSKIPTTDMLHIKSEKREAGMAHIYIQKGELLGKSDEISNQELS